MKFPLVSICLLALQFAFDASAGQQTPEAPIPSVKSSHDDAERRDLVIAMQQAAGSQIDYLRALEQHLKKYPNTSYKEKIVRSLFTVSVELKDERRIAHYGEQLLAKEPDDVSVLAEVGTALNSLEETTASQRALQIGQRLEKIIRQQAETSVGKDANAAGTEARLNQAHTLGVALAIEADAYGLTGRTPEAVTAAKLSLDTFPSAEAARSLGRWQANAGNNSLAVLAYADAFALKDSTEHRADDRRKLTELYLKQHKTTEGLGDVVLAEYDRMIALQRQMDSSSANQGDTSLANAAIVDMTGKANLLESFKGKIVVMDFWATWCQPCRVQHPLFEQVKKSFKDDSSVVFLQVNSGEERETVAPFVTKMAWTDGVYLDNGLAHRLGVDSLPTTVLLDRDSKVYSELVGFRPDTFVALLTSRIQAALASENADLSPQQQVN